MQGNTGYACWSVCPQFQSQSHPFLHTPNFKTAKRPSVKIFSSRLHNRTSLAVGDVMVVSSIFHAVYCSARSNVVGVTESDGLVVVLMKNGYIWQDQIAPWAANTDLSLMLPNDKVDLHKPEKRRLDESQKKSSCQYLWGCLCTVNIKNIIMYFCRIISQALHKENVWLHLPFSFYPWEICVQNTSTDASTQCCSINHFPCSTTMTLCI